ncbi:Transposable element Tc3 transposase [Anthophora retusa]
MKKPALNTRHKEARLLFVKEHVHWKKTWYRVIFMDEKRFNLDGPYGCTHYYRDIRKQPLTKIRRQMHGGGVMVWAGVGYKGKTEIMFVQGTMNSVRYLQIIRNQIYTYAERIAVTPYIFQQDNAAVHTAKIVKEYFLKENISILQWPACSPDLNIIENCWAMLSQAVYAEGRQFSNLNELKTCIMIEWENLDQTKIKTLYDSLPKRMVEVIENKGGCTHY